MDNIDILRKLGFEVCKKANIVNNKPVDLGFQIVIDNSFSITTIETIFASEEDAWNSSCNFYLLQKNGVFDNKISYAIKEDFAIFNVYGDGKVIAKNINKETLEKITESNPKAIIEKTINEAGYEEAKKLYNEEQTWIYETFVNIIYIENGVMDNPKKQKCFSLAYEHGHSAGFSEIKHYFDEFVELIK